MTDVRKQAVTGVVPPQVDEAIIRMAWPAVTTSPAVAGLGKTLMRTIILAPLAWLMLAPFYFKKVLPGFATRYTLTNRRLMRQRGMKPKAVEEIPLADIEEVRIAPDSNDNFYRTGTLEILSKGQVKLRLPGVPEADSFKVAIENACMAWVPGRAAAWVKFIPAKAEGAK